MSSRLSQNIFRLPEIKEKFEKFREFKCDQPVFVHFRKDWVFDIKNSTKFLSTQKSTFLTIFFPKYLLRKPCKKRNRIFGGVKTGNFTQILTILFFKFIENRNLRENVCGIVSV